MAESRGLLKILSRPRVVTQNNIQALVRQGVRVPIVTQAQLGGPPTVTYVDAFLRLDGGSADHVGRHHLPERGRGKHHARLRADDPGQPDLDHATGHHPSAGHRWRHGRDRRRDPDQQLDATCSRCRCSGNIPCLGNLFKHTQVSTSNQELIFFITPRIIQT